MQRGAPIVACMTWYTAHALLRQARLPQPPSLLSSPTPSSLIRRHRITGLTTCLGPTSPSGRLARRPPRPPFLSSESSAWPDMLATSPSHAGRPTRAVPRGKRNRVRMRQAAQSYKLHVHSVRARASGEKGLRRGTSSVFRTLSLGVHL